MRSKRPKIKMKTRPRSENGLFRFLFRDTPIPMWLYDPKTLAFLDVNAAASEKYGYMRKEFLKMTVKDIYLAGRVRGSHTDAAGSRREETHRSRHKIKDGSIINVQVTSHRLRMDGRDVIIAMATGMPGRKRAGGALRENESRYRYLFEQNPTPMFIYETRDLKILAVNDEFVAKYGYSRAEALKLHLTDLYPELEKKPIADLVRTLRGHAYAGEWHHLQKDGKRITIEAHSHGFTYDGRAARVVVVSDISERKRVEDALRDSEKRLTRAESVARMGFLDWDLKTNRIFLSDEACRIHGIERHEELLSPELIARAVHPDDLSVVNSGLEQAISGAKPYDIDHRVIRPDGTMRWVHAQAQLLRNSEGVPERLLGTVVDITERKRAEEALNESEEQYRKLVTLLPDALFVNVDARIVLANPTCCRLLGAADPSELIGKSIFEIVHPEYHDRVRERRRVTLAGGSSSLTEERYIRLDGTVVDVDVVSAGIEWRGSRGTQVIVRETTERKKAERELRESQERYRKLFEDHTAVKFIIDPETGALLDANEAAVRFYGWTREELKRMTIREINVLPPAQLKTELEKAASKAQDHFEFRHHLADGSVRDVEVFTSKIEINGKSILESIVHDITERKHAEEALRESEERYRRLITFLSDPVYIHVDSRVTFVNEAMCRLIGAEDPSQLLGKSIFEILHPDFHEVVRRRLPLVFSGRTAPILEEKFVRLDGTSVDVEVSAVAIEWRGAVGVQVMARDITERKKAEAEIRKLNRIYNVLSNINQAIVRIHHTQLLFSETCRIAVEQGGFVMAWLGAVNPETQKVDVLASSGVTDDYLRNINIDLKDESRRKGPTGRAIISGTYVVSNRIDRDESMLPWQNGAARMGYRSSAAFPIKVSGKVWGVFNLYSDEPGSFNDDEIKLLDELAMDISFAIEFIQEESERKKAEESLQKSEELLQSSVRVANIGIFEHDRLNDTIFWSPRQREIYGLGPDDPVTLQTFLAQIYPEDTDRVVSSVQRAHDPSGDGLWDIEHRIVRRDGTVRWLAERSQTFFEGEGRARHPVRTVGAALDITGRKEAEERLRLSDEIIKRVNSLILIADAHGRITYASPSIKSILGYEQEEVLGDGWWRLTHQDDPDRIDTRKDVAAAARGDIPVTEAAYETKVLSKNGEIHWILWQDSMGVNRELIGVGQDITDRKQAEEALVLSERKYKDIFESAPLGIYQSTLDGRFITCNSELAKILGYDSPEDLTDLDMATDIYYEKEERAALIARFKPHGSAADLEIRWKKKDGAPVWIQLNSRAIRDANGKTLRFEGFVRNITERKQAEEQLKQNETKRHELELELIQAQKLESLGTLASGIAHDFNNLLGVIIGNASLLEELLGDSPAAYKKNIDAILRASTRGAAVVKQMLTFARKTDVLIESVMLNDLVNEIVRLIRETFSRTIRVEADLAPDLPSIDADATQVHQVLLNLCVNARDSMPDGGTLIITTCRESGKELRDRRPNATADSYVVLSVEDTGTGMDEETQRRIFEPFFTTKEHGKGTGLGLSLVFGIMQSHDGFITFRTEPGKGTIFQCYFPVPAGAPQIPKVETERSEMIPAGNETVLVVEDEDLLRELLTQILVSKGYTVLSAEDGECGFATYQKHRSEIALVISDLGLPKFGGDELYRRLKEADSDVRLILSSGYIEPGMRATILEEGVKDVIPKPYNPDEVLRTVRRVLDGN